ncbi:MAG: acyltransferase [Gemmatimonadaceae bacterium]|nr:acyltransferase [Gemmatimonadaceae bacterium]
MRYTTLDSWRGICALLVVLHHAEGGGAIGSSELVRGAFLFVDFFFVLSGFVLCEGYLSRFDDATGYLGFLLRRLGRLWPLHAALMVAFLCLELAKLAVTRVVGMQFTNLPFTGTLEPSAFLPGLLLLHSMGFLSGLTWNIPSWSIAAEFWTYAVFGLVVWRLRTRVALAAALIAGAATLLLVLRSDALMNVSYDLGFVRCLYGFFGGVLLHRCSRGLRQRGPLFGTGVEVVAVTAGGVFVARCHDTTLAYVSPLVFALVILVFACSGGGLSRLLSAPGFVRLGTWSYSIYLTHVFLLGLVSMGARLLGRLAGARDGGPVWDRFLAAAGASDWSVLAFALLVVAVSSQTYRLIEVPAQQAVNRRVAALVGVGARGGRAPRADRSSQQ